MINGVSVFDVVKNDNSGNPTLCLMSDITTWYNSKKDAPNYGFTGLVFSTRTNGYNKEDIDPIVMRVGYANNITTDIYSSTYTNTCVLAGNRNITPVIVKNSTSNKYYLALYCEGVGNTIKLMGRYINLLSSFIYLLCDSKGAIQDTNYEFVINPDVVKKHKASVYQSKQAIALTGFSAPSILKTNVPTWGVFKDGSYNIIHRAETDDGGAWIYGTKDRQLSLQLDGYFYQNQGENQVLDDREKDASTDGTLANQISKKANKSVVVNTTISASKWVANTSEGTWTNTITVNGVTTSNIVELTTTNNSTLAQIKAYQKSNIMGVSQTTNSIVLKALNSKPTIDLPITCIIRD